MFHPLRRPTLAVPALLATVAPRARVGRGKAAAMLIAALAAFRCPAAPPWASSISPRKP